MPARLRLHRHQRLGPLANRGRPPRNRQQPSPGRDRLDITEQEIYEYLSRVALGPEKLGDVFSVEGLVTIPLFATANLLLTFCPRDNEWWECLDQIWDATETAEHTSLTVLPALTLRTHKEPARVAAVEPSTG